MNSESIQDTNKGEHQRLRESIHEKMEVEVEKRIDENPVPTETEIRLGAFSEMIEPQVRDAVFTFQSKGYAPESSGFGGDLGDIQQIDGFFEIDEETKARLESMGVSVETDRDRGLH